MGGAVLPRDRRRPRVVRALPAGMGPRRRSAAAASSPSARAPRPTRLDRARSGRPWPSTTSPACGPGTAPSSSPWCVAAYERGRPDGRPAPCWRTSSGGPRRCDRFTPIRVEVDVDVHVPDPCSTRPRPATARTAPGALPRPGPRWWSSTTTTSAAGSGSTAWSTSSPTATSSPSTSGHPRVLGLGRRRARGSGRRRPVHRVPPRLASSGVRVVAHTTTEKAGARQPPRPRRAEMLATDLVVDPTPRGRTARDARSGDRASP